LNGYINFQENKSKNKRGAHVRRAMSDSLKHMKNGNCKKCGTTKVWKMCTNCEYGFSRHDCGEDVCCCVLPVDNVVCDICEGKEGYYVCPSCSEGMFDDNGFESV
jgi:hypothetical protein